MFSSYEAATKENMVRSKRKISEHLENTITNISIKENQPHPIPRFGMCHLLYIEPEYKRV